MLHSSAISFAVLVPPYRVRHAKTFSVWLGCFGATVEDIQLLLFGIVGYAKSTSHWTGDVPDYMYRQLVPRANNVNHPSE